ncbi:MAG: hypothetical protein V4598_00940 [Bdellovibrionota bacterium]
MKVYLFILVFFSTSLVAAEDLCQAEKEKYCAPFTSPVEQTNCLVLNREQLSPQCLQELQRLNQIVKETGSRSGGLASFGGITGGLGLVPPKKTILTAEGLSAWQGNPVVMNQGRASLTSPVWTSGEKSFTSSLSASTVKINERVIAPDGDKVGELHRVELGGNYSRMSDTKGLLGVRGSLGSAGDKLFHSSRDFIFSASAYYAPPEQEKDSHWIYTLSIFNNNGFANYIPLPGFIYLYKTETFTGMFGLPFLSMQWTPVKPWLLSFSFFITNLKSSISYSLSDSSILSLGFSINQQVFLREDREENRDRLFLNDKRIYLGYRQILSQALNLEIQGGQSFDRSLREGRRFNDTEWRRDLGRSYYASLAANFSF